MKLRDIFLVREKRKQASSKEAELKTAIENCNNALEAVQEDLDSSLKAALLSLAIEVKLAAQELGISSTEDDYLIVGEWEIKNLTSDTPQITKLPE